jgi:hypothetical protein
MSFLDRFKPQPRWKHADPAVRAAAVAELMTDDPEQRRALFELAQGDEDLRVRRAAVARVAEISELVQLARTERDEGLRREMTDRLVSIATTASPSDGDAAQALDGLDDQKQLASVAKISPHETVRTAALGRIHDVRLLGNVARHALDAQTALEAVARVADATELLNIALKTDHRDAGVAALDRITADTPAEETRRTCELVAARARNKFIAKRARAVIQTFEETERKRQAALDHWQQRLASVLAGAEGLAGARVGDDTAAKLEEVEADWQELTSAEAFVVDSDAAARFDTLVAEVRGAMERYAHAQAEQRAVEERRAGLQAAKEELCRRVELLDGESGLEALDSVRAEWEGLLARDEPTEGDATGGELQARFEEACRRVAERHANRQVEEQSRMRLGDLSLEAERASAAEVFDEGAWQALSSEWASLVDKVEGLDEGVAHRFAEAERRVVERAAERRNAEERAVRQQVQRVEQLIERAQARAAAEDLPLREADRLVRDLRTAIDAQTEVPGIGERERQELMDRLRAALAVVMPRLHDLREMDEWKRFANAAIQEELIARTEGLRAKYQLDVEGGPSSENVEKAARDLHEIQERWKQVAEAPRAQAQALWHRYRQAADPIQALARQLFAGRAEERKANLARKLSIIERAEAIADSTDWVKTAEEMKKLQHEWQQTGDVPRHDTRATWKRFREACDKFFTRRNADLAERKETWAANLAKKEALCARAEELSSSRDWDRAAAEIRRLQNEWRTIGPVRRTKSEVIWQRFRAACDTFFDRYKRRDEIELEAKQADREGLIQELDALAEPPAPDAPERTPADLLERVRALRTRWNQTSSIVRQGADPLTERFAGALERVMLAHPEQFRGTELDVDANRRRMETLVAKVEGFLADAPPAPTNSSQALAEMLREALASNTIGGRAGDEARWRAMGDDVRQAQAAWSRLGPVPGQDGRELTERFHRACNRFIEQYRRRVPPEQQGGGGGRRKELQTR